MPKHIEDQHQEALIRWTQFVKVTLPDGSTTKLHDVIYAIPNGGKRGKLEAARLKKQGVKAGVSDLHLIVPSQGFCSLYIEMKQPIVKGRAKPSVQTTQKAWLKLASQCGHAGNIAYGVEQAKEFIREYLGDKLLEQRAAYVIDR